MLSQEEKKKLMWMMLLDSPEQSEWKQWNKPHQRNTDVSDRLRDDLGRFAIQEEEEYGSDYVERRIRLVKQPETYGSYDVEEDNASGLRALVVVFITIAFFVGRWL